jgi:putative ABC transport system permease protein
VRLSALVELYRWRLKNHLVQELLAGLGIAFGVALFFGVLVANTSITSSATRLVHAVTGSSQFEVAARSSAGVDESVVDQVARMPGVLVASPILREDASIVGPRGHRLVQLLGVSASLAVLHAAVARNIGASPALLTDGIAVPAGIADAVGAEAGGSVRLLSGGDAHVVAVRAVLTEALVGAVAESPFAVALLPVAQMLGERPRTVTQILVETQPGAAKQVQGELARAFRERLDVEPADHELRLLKGASAPTEQSTALFAAISAIVGFLLALNAMLLTVPERRRFVADLRTQGFGPRQVLLILSSQAVMLGLAGSIVGVALGDYLSHALFGTIPSYLTFAFPIGAHGVASLAIVTAAIVCGLLAALLASLPPMLDLRPRRALDATLHEVGEAGQGIGRELLARTAGAGFALIVIVTALLAAFPGLTVLGGVLLAVAAVLLAPSVFAVFGVIVTPASERIHGSMLALAVVEFRATATRSVALAGVAAIAVYGNVAIQGARQDLTSGLDAAVTEYLASADVWVTTGENVFTTDSFPARGAVAAVQRVPGVASVRVYQGGLLDVGSRRLWIRARPSGDSHLLQPSQLLEGNLARGTKLLRGTGWAAVSSAFAREHRLHLDSVFTLPAPAGSVPLRVAAITTNAGWPPGAITLSSADYARYWRTSDPSALEVSLAPGASAARVARVARGVRAALANRPGLEVQTRAAREAQFKANARQGLRSLGQIATLLLLVAALAIAFALSAAIWQRRERLASLKSQGFDSGQLWRALLLESSIVLGVGCVDGALLGVFGHALASRWLRLTTGFPAPFSIGPLAVLATLGLVAGVALSVVLIPGLAAARVAPRAGFQE